MRILGISGSLRKDSHNTALLRAAAELLPPGVELELFDGLKAIPPYDADEDTPELQGPAVQALKDAIERADAVLISTPEYNHSIPGVLKNALDWASRPVADTVLRGKPAAVIGASTGLFGAVWAQAEVRKVLGAIGAEVVDRELPVMQAHAQFDEYGNLHEEDLRSQLAEHVAALVDARRATRRSPPPRRRRSGSRGREPGPRDVAPTARASTLRSTSRPMRASARGALAVGHAHHVLLDDRPGVELLGDVVRRGADDLHPALHARAGRDRRRRRPAGTSGGC